MAQYPMLEPGLWWRAIRRFSRPDPALSGQSTNTSARWLFYRFPCRDRCAIAQRVLRSLKCIVRGNAGADATPSMSRNN